jgi:hypothetical protein
MPPRNGMPIYNKPDAERAWAKLVALYKTALGSFRLTFSVPLMPKIADCGRLAGRPVDGSDDRRQGGEALILMVR